MKPIVFTDIVNRTEHQAKMIGCTHMVKGMQLLPEAKWFRLYYKNIENAQKEADRMNKLPQVWKHVSEPILLK